MLIAVSVRIKSSLPPLLPILLRRRSLTIIGGDSKPTIDQSSSGSDAKREEEKAVSPKENGSLLMLGDDDDGNDSDNSSVVSESSVSTGGRPRTSSSRLPSASARGHYGARQRTVSTPHGSKLSSASSSPSLGDGSSPSDAHPQAGSRSGLKQPGSGRTTPGFSGSGRATPGPGDGKSGIARPASRLTKPGTIHEKAAATTKSEESAVTASGGPRTEMQNGESSEQPSKLRLVRKVSDGATKRIKIEAGGTSSLPRHLPKGVTSAAGASHPASRLSPLSSNSRRHESVAASKSSEDAPTSTAASTLTTEAHSSERPHHVTEGGDGKRVLEGPKRMLKRPGDSISGGPGSTGVHATNIGFGSPAPPSSSSSPSANASTGTSTERTQKSGDLLPSRLTRGTSLGSGLKPPGENRKIQPPQLISKPRSTAGRDYSSGSTSSLESNGSGGDSVTTKSSIGDGGKDRLRSAEGATVTNQGGVPASLNLPSERDLETEKPPSKKESQSGSAPGKGRPDCSRRSSPEGMSHEEIATSPKAESNDSIKAAVEQKNLKNEKELEKGKGGGGQVMINGDLSLEQKRVGKTARDVHSSNVSSPSEIPNSAGKDSRSGQGKERTAPTESTSKSFSQPETGQPYSDSMSQLSPETKRSAVSFEETETTGSEQRPSGSDTSEQEELPAIKKTGSGRQSHPTKPHVLLSAKRARSLSPNNTRRVFPLPVVPVLDHESSSSQPATPSSPGGRNKMDFHHTSSALARTRSGGDPASSAQSLGKPLRSSLRNSKSSGGTSSSSSLDSANSKNHHGQKVHMHVRVHLGSHACTCTPELTYHGSTCRTLRLHCLGALLVLLQALG